MNPNVLFFDSAGRMAPTSHMEKLLWKKSYFQIHTKFKNRVVFSLFRSVQLHVSICPSLVRAIFPTEKRVHCLRTRNSVNSNWNSNYLSLIVTMQITGKPIKTLLHFVGNVKSIVVSSGFQPWVCSSLVRCDILMSNVSIFSIASFQKCRCPEAQRSAHK